MHKVNNTAADAVYVNPQTDYTQYTRVYVAPLVTKGVEIVQPASSTRTASKWELTDEERAKLSDYFQESMGRELSRDGGYEVVTEPEAGTLIITGRLVALAPTAPKDDFRNRPFGRSRVITEGAGSLTLALAVHDAQTGEQLATAIDSKSDSSAWGSNNRVSNVAAVKRIFNRFAIQLRGGLESMKQLTR
jgi:hypothetical protein